LEIKIISKGETGVEELLKQILASQKEIQKTLE
jgi:hypothetical protein